jgi:hypothetical protein
MSGIKLLKKNLHIPNHVECVERSSLTTSLSSSSSPAYPLLQHLLLHFLPVLVLVLLPLLLLILVTPCLILIRLDLGQI